MSSNIFVAKEEKNRSEMTSPFDVTQVDEPQAFASRLAAPRAGPSVIILSAPMQVNLAVYRGDSGQFRITVADPGGNPVDMSGATWDGDVRIKATDPDPLVTFDITLVAGDPSSVDVVLTAENSELLTPNNLVYDIEMREGETVSTLIYGTITVTQDVSRP
jgi:hypothetical protein